MARKSVSTKRKQKPPHLFKPGQSGNPRGRPPGSRNKLSEDFIGALARDFAEHGVRAVETVRDTKPEVYLRIVADLVPKDYNLKHDASETLMALLRANS